jgi:molecular chaperone DnaK
MITVGIDLGTTNTVAAVGGRVFTLDRQGGPLLPSVVAFPPTGIRMVGTDARRRRPIDPRNTIFSSKRLIGRKWYSADVKEFMSRYDFALEQDAEGGPSFITRSGSFNPVDVAMLILERVCNYSEHPADEIAAVITVPSMFGEAEREATREAGVQAGLAGIRIVEEPVAVATAYLSRRASAEACRAAVYDLGGGTFDLAVVECRGTEVRILGFGGDLYLGGDDVDKRLSEWAADEVLERHRWDLRGDPAVYARLFAECEQAKIRLSEEDRTRIDLTRVDPSSPLAVVELAIDRGLLAGLVSETVQRTFVICDEVLGKVGVKPGDLDALFVAGGSTQMPLLKKEVEAYFGRPIAYEFHPMHTVAIGASLVGRRPPSRRDDGLGVRIPDTFGQGCLPRRRLKNTESSGTRSRAATMKNAAMPQRPESAR